jgi:hypothetical protein
MIDEHEVREMLLRRAHTVPAAPVGTPTVVRRARRRLVLNAAVATVAAAAIAVAVFAGVDAIRSAPIPADEPTPTGIFAPVAGRIVYENEAEVGDLGYDLGLWAIDPSGPSDTAVGRSVADDVASTLTRLDVEEATPLGWSSDGTELLLSRPDAASAESLFPQEYLSVLHADGSETRLHRDPMSFGGATISPDGTRVVFAAWGDDLGLWVVDAEGGRPVRLPFPEAEGIVADPTFSPDGTQIAYVDTGDPENHVWVMDADGSNAHEILANEPTLVGGAGNLRWSPAGDRIAIQVRAPDPDGTNSIYTFGPDGSDVTRVVSAALSPYWSPDGSQIAYTIECQELTSASCLGAGSAGLAIADADGSNIRAFGFASSGPWHPGASVEDPPSTLPDTPTPAPPGWSPVQERDASIIRRGRTEDYGIAWRDPHDAPVGWVDVERVFTQGQTDGYWEIELAAKPPPAAGLEPGRLIAYGLVLDTTVDGVADYLIGIDNDAPQRGDFHVWVTDLTTGETDEQIGGPYGYPIEFKHPDEWQPGDGPGPPHMTFTFLDDSTIPDLNPDTVRFYAWASATRDGEVVARDYAPDTGWMSRSCRVSLDPVCDA